MTVSPASRCCANHHPDRPRPFECGYQFLDRRGAGGHAFGDQRCDDLGVAVVHHAVDAVVVQATNQVRAHPSEPDHA
jgi:hypothetical protein